MTSNPTVFPARLADESNKAFAAFQIYCRLNPKKRTSAEVARASCVSSKTVSIWCTKYEWKARLAERESRKEEKIALIEDTLTMIAARRHRERAQRLQDIALGEIERLARFSEESDVPLIRPADAIHMFEVGFKIERLIDGQPIEKSDHTIASRPLTDEEMRRFSRVLLSSTEPEDEVIVEID